MFVESFKVASPNVTYTDDAVVASYNYNTTSVCVDPVTGSATATPTSTRYTFSTSTTPPPRLGVMLVGLGGNNGTTFVAGLLAHRRKLSWETKHGARSPNFLGSMIMSSTFRVGRDARSGADVHAPLRSAVPFAHPDAIVVDGWDVAGSDLAQGMRDAGAVDVDLQRQLRAEMKKVRPRRAVWYPGFVAANQGERADNVMGGAGRRGKGEDLEQVRRDIREFKEREGVDAVVVVWTATTERFCVEEEGVHDTAENVLRAIGESHPEISPSVVYAAGSLLEGCAFVNGSPQNTLVPGVVELAERQGVFVGGDDFKTGQTKLKSVLVDFLVSAGIKPRAIVSYNHLGNNDGRNLSAPAQFRSKEISKSNVVDDMVRSNPILYPAGEHPDHVVVIKYVPSVGDSKRAMDEYTADIFLGGTQTIVAHNTCEDSLLAAPVLLDLVLLSELSTRIRYKTDEMPDYASFSAVLGWLAYMLKAPVVPAGAPVVNALFKQRACVENVLRACVGLPPENDMRLETMAPALADRAGAAAGGGFKGNGAAGTPHEHANGHAA